MTTISARVVCDSVSVSGVRLPTVELRYPRFIHAELMTHRVFSRNARSSRAVPVERMLTEVESDPVVPLYWGANQKGMQAGTECSTDVGLPVTDSFTERLVYREMGSRDAWLWARDHAVVAARAFADAGYHKQVANRLLEPFLHIDTLVSATDWENFLWLRDHSAAEPHIQDLARAVRAALDGSIPELVEDDGWHLPYIREEDMPAIRDHARIQMFGPDVALADDKVLEPLVVSTTVAVSTARCARISYTPFDGNDSVESELRRHDLLVGSEPLHASPAEHVAQPDTYATGGSFDRRRPTRDWAHPEQHGNFRGWRQYRKMLRGECRPG